MIALSHRDEPEEGDHIVKLVTLSKMSDRISSAKPSNKVIALKYGDAIQCE